MAARILTLASVISFLGGCARERVVVREPVRVEVPVISCANIPADAVEPIDLPALPDAPTYGDVVEWSADLRARLERAIADREVVRKALPPRCIR